MSGVIGVDPGATGALALLDAGRRDLLGVPSLVTVAPIPAIEVKVGKRKSRVVDGRRLAQMLCDLERGTPLSSAAVEVVASMPADKPPQAFAFGRSLGGVEATLQAHGLVITRVPVATWRQATGVARATADDAKARRREHKAACRARAIELWPDQKDLFRRVKDTDAAEAALIALSTC
jgi:hypothetical protein